MQNTLQIPTVARVSLVIALVTMKRFQPDRHAITLFHFDAA